MFIGPAWIHELIYMDVLMDVNRLLCEEIQRHTWQSVASSTYSSVNTEYNEQRPFVWFIDSITIGQRTPALCKSQLYGYTFLNF